MIAGTRLLKLYNLTTGMVCSTPFIDIIGKVVFDYILCILKYVLVCRHEMVAVRIQNTVVQICLRAYLMLPRSRHRVSIYGRGRERERMRVLALGGSL